MKPIKINLLGPLVGFRDPERMDLWEEDCPYQHEDLKNLRLFWDALKGNKKNNGNQEEAKGKIEENQREPKR